MQRLVTAKSAIGLYLTEPDLTCRRVPMNIIKWLIYGLFCTLIYPLTTDDAIWRQFLAACQLAQSVLKIGSALAERVGQWEVSGCTTQADSAWRPLQLPVEKPWSMLGGPFVCLLARTGIENAPFILYRLHFWHFRQLLVRRSALWLEGPDY